MLNKILKSFIFLILFAIPICLYILHHHKEEPSRHRPVHRHVSRTAANPSSEVPVIPEPLVETQPAKLPEIAIIFDDLGENVKEVSELYSLGVPLTASIIPGLKYSTQSATMAAHCGFSVFIHLPMEPEGVKAFRTKKYTFISPSQTPREVKSLLRYYLNSLPQAIGVNNHMGSAATVDRPLMEIVIAAIKQRNLIFVDSRTSPKSIAYDVAVSQGLTAGSNNGFIDAVDNEAFIKERLGLLVRKASEQGKIIVIAHPRKRTIAVLKEELPSLKAKIRFVTIKDYFAN